MVFNMTTHMCNHYQSVLEHLEHHLKHKPLLPSSPQPSAPPDLPSVSVDFPVLYVMLDTNLKRLAMCHSSSCQQPFMKLSLMEFNLFKHTCIFLDLALFLILRLVF